MIAFCPFLSDFVRTFACRWPRPSAISIWGGGLGIPYREDNEPPPHPEAYAAMVKRATRDLDCTLIFEPGTSDRRQCGHPVDPRALPQAR